MSVIFILLIIMYLNREDHLERVLFYMDALMTLYTNKRHYSTRHAFTCLQLEYLILKASVVCSS